MNRVGYIIIFILLCFFTGCNTQQKSTLQEAIKQNIPSQCDYTTLSYTNYILALENAKTVEKGPFASAKKIQQALLRLQNAADELKPATKGVYRVDYSFTLRSNHSVGNDWHTAITYNGQELHSGDTVTQALHTEIVLQSTVTEQDRFPDVGNGTLQLTLADGATAETLITVTEDRGTFCGNTAVWALSCRITLVEII